MKAKRDREGKGVRRQSRRAVRQRLRARAEVFTVALIVTLVAVLLFFTLRAGGAHAPPSAVIIDQLSLTVPNPQFVKAATEVLQGAGYAVDYYPGERVTVDFYRDLATQGHELVIFRVHSGVSREVDLGTGEVTEMEFVSLFTGEPYRKDKYWKEQIQKLLGEGRTSYDDGNSSLFGIGPRFIKNSMKGKFDEAILILMGCDGLMTPITANALLDRGASAVVGWTDEVSSTHTDDATLRLLKELMVEGRTVQDAVERVVLEVGPDPWYGAELQMLSGVG